MITLCCYGLSVFIYFSASSDIYLWWLSHYLDMWWYLCHYITPSFNWFFFPRLGRRFVGPLMCYAQPGLHDLLSYSLYSAHQLIRASIQEVIKSWLQRNASCWAPILRSGKCYTGKAFYVTAAIEITCHDHSMLLWSVRYYIFFS